MGMRFILGDGVLIAQPRIDSVYEIEACLSK